MNTLVIAIILGSLLVSSMFYFLINAFKKLKITISPGPGPGPAPAPAPSNSVVTINSDGIQISKPSTTEGYISEALSCKKPKHVDRSEFEGGNMHGGFSDYESFEAKRLNDIDEMWGENGYCKLAGIDEENEEGFIIGYQYHEGDFKQRVFDSDTKKCTFSQDPYACLYKEVKDDDGNIIGVENNEGKKLEVEFYNDYKAGKLQPFMDEIGMGTRMKFYWNDEEPSKLVFWQAGYHNGHENVPAQEFVIKPGYNYPVLFMLLGTAMTMADDGIDMPANGLSISFKSLSEDEIRRNMENDLENTRRHRGPGPGPGPA